jgi:prepilin-type N-terminal cleavage/methylation domain-containing protein
MCKLFSESPELRHPKGFTFVELMVAMALSLILLGITFNLFNQLNAAADLAGTMADVNQNLRASVNLIARDLSTAGAEIPQGGIPLPGGGTSTLIKRPWPAATTFPATGYMAVITPGPGLGPSTGSGGTAIPTDAITLITVNPLSQLDQFPLWGIATTASPASVTITMNPGTDISTGPTQVVAGQLIMLKNNSACLLAATAFNYTNRTITFTQGDVVNDPLGLNQFGGTPQFLAGGPTTGTISQIGPGGAFPLATGTTAYHINMITYYLDTSNPQKLMRKVGTGPAQAVALGINVLQFAFSLSPPATPTDPTRTVAAPNTIRKVNLWVIAIADHMNRKSLKYYSNSIATSVTVQNLAYFNRY